MNVSSPGRSSVTSENRSSVGSKNSLGLVLASLSSLNPLSTIQNNGEEEDQSDDPGEEAEEVGDGLVLTEHGLGLVALEPLAGALH